MAMNNSYGYNERKNEIIENCLNNRENPILKKKQRISEQKLTSVTRSIFFYIWIHQEFIIRQNVQVNKLKCNSLKLFK